MFVADEGSQNRDTLLPLDDESAQLVPGADAGDVRRIRPVARNGEDVAKAVIVEASHCCEIGSERLALALFKLLNEELDVLCNDLLCGVLLAVTCLLSGVAGAAAVGAGKGSIHDKPPWPWN